MFESFSFIGFSIAYLCLINSMIKTLFPLCGIEVYFKLWFSKSSKLLLDQHASKQFNFEANWDSKNLNLNNVQIFSKQIL